MKTVLKIAGLCFGFLIILTIEINNVTVFNHIYSIIAPATKYSQAAIESLFNKSVKSTTSYTKKLFDNSVPNVKDAVKSRQAAIKSAGEPEEKITNEDKEELDQLIKSR